MTNQGIIEGRCDSEGEAVSGGWVGRSGVTEVKFPSRKQFAYGRASSNDEFFAPSRAFAVSHSFHSPNSISKELSRF